MSDLNGKSVQKVSKKKSGIYSKTDSRYWKDRIFKNQYGNSGTSLESSDWCMKIKFQGRRETINLKTPNKTAAADKAATTYKQLLTLGWDGVRPRSSVEENVKPEVTTIGMIITEYNKLTTARPESVDTYTKALRRLAADICGIKSPDKYDTQGDGSLNWRTLVDSIPIHSITPSAVMGWKNEMIRSVRSIDDRNKMIVTVNSIIRNAKAIFSKRLMPFLQAQVQLPAPLPFDGVPLEKQPSLRYKSQIDAVKILQDANDELLYTHPQAYLALLLCLVFGLRRSEADWLLWTQVDLTRGILIIEDNQFKQLKSADSAGTIDIEPVFLEILKQFFNKRKGQFVLDTPPSIRRKRIQNPKGRGYRANDTFSSLHKWLVAKGVPNNKPIHSLRKEIGSVIASKQGIFAASRYLRHSDIRITSQIYTDKKQPIVSGLGTELNLSMRSHETR